MARLRRRPVGRPSARLGRHAVPTRWNSFAVPDSHPPPSAARPRAGPHGGRAIPGRRGPASAFFASPPGRRQRWRAARQSQPRALAWSLTRGSRIPYRPNSLHRIPDPAPRFVKCGAGYAEQSHEEHAVVEPVGCGPHAGEVLELDVETFGNARLDQSTGHQGRSEIRSIACSPRPRDGQLVRLEAIPLQILERTIAGHCEFVRERSEFPAFAAGVPAAHQCVAPIEVAAAGDVDVDMLVDARVGKRDQRMPMTVQVSAIIDVIRALEMGGPAVGRRMDLQRRLRGQPHARAAPDADDLLKVIVPECARGRRGEDHVHAVTLGKPSSDAEWWLGISPGQHRAAVAVEKGEIQQGVPSDDRGGARVAMLRGRPQWVPFRLYARTGCSYSNSRRIHATTPSRPAPPLRFMKTNGRSPRIILASRAMTSRLAPTCGARSILLITRRSERVTPGPPLRGILSPPETSMT